MQRIVLMATIALLLVMGIVACSSSDSTNATEVNSSENAQPDGLIAATWIDPQINGSTFSIPRSEAENNWNTHFGLGEIHGNMNFMAYILDGEIFVRANVCPPCRSVGFSLDSDELVCDSCRTLFDAQTGEGISGACKDFPKATVAHEIIEGQIVMQLGDLTTAYEDTTQAGWP